MICSFSIKERVVKTFSDGVHVAVSLDNPVSLKIDAFSPFSHLNSVFFSKNILKHSVETYF